MLTQINPQNYQLNMSSFSQLYYNLINRLSFTIRPIMPRPHYKTRRGVCPSVRCPSVSCLLLLLLSVRLYAYGRNFRENKSVDKWLKCPGQAGSSGDVAPRMRRRMRPGWGLPLPQSTRAFGGASSALPVGSGTEKNEYESFAQNRTLFNMDNFIFSWTIRQAHAGGSNRSKGGEHHGPSL